MAEAHSDETILEVLDGTAKGESMAQVGKKLGLTRNAVAALLYRNRADNAFVEDRCIKPENMDSGMPDRWWVRV